jgi:Protein of unknown function (DUF4230)
MKQVWLLILSALLLTVGLFTYVQRRVDPPVETIVASSLQSLHEQNRLSAFAARFVTVVTSSKARYGLSAEKTLIIPAMVRYEVDLAKLTATDVKWDAAAKVLSITLPPVEISGPEFDLAQTREYESGVLLLTLTDVESRLDAENRAKAKADILTQAHAAPMMKLARAASIRAISTSFSLPLAAAGVDAKVVAKFAGG